MNLDQFPTEKISSETESSPHPWATKFRKFGVVLWPAFLSAGIANMVFFALVDPVSLHQISFPNWHMAPEFGYTLGFFMFFAVTAFSSFMTSVLLDTQSARTLESKQDSKTSESNS